MKPIIFLSALFLCGSVQAGLEGAYELTSGSEEKCPDGSLQTRAFEEGRVLIFGARHSWPLDMKDASRIKSVVPGGCTYVWAYEKTDNRFVNRTTRSNCPLKGKAAEGVVTEKMTSRDSTLVYEYAFKKTNFRCQYKKKD